MFVSGYTINIMKHTQGEWSIYKNGLHNGFSINVKNTIEDDVCKINNSRPDAEANAKLISAAPDLLKALQSIKRWYEAGETEKTFVKNKMYKAIEKATK